MSNNYCIRGQNGEYIISRKDVDGEYSFYTSTNPKEAELMNLKFAKEILANLNDDGWDYFKIQKVEV